MPESGEMVGVIALHDLSLRGNETGGDFFSQ